MERSQIKGGAILNFIALFIGNIVSLLYTPFMLSSLGQVEYGLFGLSNSIVGYLTILDFGFGSAAIRYTAKYKAENKENKLKYMYGMFIFLYTIIGLITFISGILISRNTGLIFKDGLSLDEISTVKILLILSSINLAISFPFSVFSSIITAFEKFIFLRSVAIVRAIINPLVYIPVLILGYKSIGLVITMTILNLIFLLINLFYCFIKIKIKISFKRFDLKFLKNIFSYSVWIFIGSIVNQLWWNSGQFLLGIYSSAVSIAIFSLAMQFKNYFESFATSISGVFLPRLTAMEVSSKINDENFSDIFIKIGRLQFILISLLTSGFILFGRQFISLWAGDGYEEAYYVTLIIFIPLSLVDTQTLGISILQAKNKHKFRSILYLFVSLVCIILCIPMIKTYGVIGCAIATATSLTLGNLIIMNWYYSKKIHLDITRFWKELIKMLPGVLLSSTIMYFIIEFLFTNLKTLKLLLSLILFYVIFYFVSMYIISFNDYEKNLTKNYIKKFGRKLNKI